MPHIKGVKIMESKKMTIKEAIEYAEMQDLTDKQMFTLKRILYSYKWMIEKEVKCFVCNDISLNYEILIDLYVDEVNGYLSSDERKKIVITEGLLNKISE